jgi:serine/threonine protein kinase
MKLLEAATRSAIEKLHANGVYHGDIRGSNILWSLSTRRLVLLDFEMSLVFDGKKDHVIKVWKELDRGDLDYVLGKCRGRLPSLYP